MPIYEMRLQEDGSLQGDWEEENRGPVSLSGNSDAMLSCHGVSLDPDMDLGAARAQYSHLAESTGSSSGGLLLEYECLSPRRSPRKVMPARDAVVI